MTQNLVFERLPDLPPLKFKRVQGSIYEEVKPSDCELFGIVHLRKDREIYE